MRKNLSILLLWLLALSCPLTVPAQEPISGSLAIVTSPLANVHEAPLPKARLETQVLMGEEVLILEKKDYRYRIAIPSQGGLEGWIQQEAVFIPKDKGKHYLGAPRPWIVVARPKTDALILDKTGNHKVPLYAATRLPVLEKNQDGYKVQLPDRSLALIDLAEAIPVKSDDPIMNTTRPEEIADTAKRFQGVRFLAGGMTAQGIDTNGLISIVYRVHGFLLGREGARFREKGTRVSKRDLQPGDILVFVGDHQGLYLGSGRFLQAARKRAVHIYGIYDRRYARSLQFGIRIIGAVPAENKRMAEMTADDILLTQARIAELPLGKRISYWAGRFIGTPYDPDPLGLYVRTNRIVADEKVDCMYHVFRSVELARSSTPGEAIERALDLRFLKKGKLADGLVTNYDERFQYGEDMVTSGKWGKNITADIGTTKTIPGSRGKDTVDIVPKNVLLTRAAQQKLKDGDIVYWVKDPKKRFVEEIVAHLSIVQVKAGKPYLIHAAGDKDRDGRPGGGVVKEVPFVDYVRHMKFIGAFVTRFEH